MFEAEVIPLLEVEPLLEIEEASWQERAALRPDRSGGILP